MPTYSPAEPPRRQDSWAQAGSQANSDTRNANTLVNLVQTIRRNFIDQDIQIMEGLTFNQYKLLKRLHFYLNSQFEDGNLDENENEKYFHNIINHRLAHATKNIDLDTKDILVSTDREDGWWLTFILRNEVRRWMDKHGFAKNLNQLSEDLPKFGKIIWCKSKDKDGKTCVENVDLRDCIFDPAARTIKESAVFIHRTIMAPWQIMEKVDKGLWDRDAAIGIINSGQPKIDRFLKSTPAAGTASTTYAMTDTIPNLDIYNCWGWFPKDDVYEAMGIEDLDEADKEESLQDERTEYVYANVILGGIEAGSEAGHVLYAAECDEEEFNYKECNYHRKQPGRCLPISDAELLLDLQVRMNELVTRFFGALRLGSLHLYQTRGTQAQKNLLQDVQDGDIIEVRQEIVPIATELRAFSQYETELQNIENQADRICNTVEVVTGESMPTNTPFRLGAQLGASAQKIFDLVREDCGIFITEVFRDWILPEIMDSLTEEHIIEVLGSVEELTAFDQMYRKYLLANQVKDYVLHIGRLPTEEEMKVVEQTLADELKNSERRVKVEKQFLSAKTLENLRIDFDVTDERRSFQARAETMSNLLQIIASNPMILQDPTAKGLLARIMEEKGFSPLFLASISSSPAPQGAQPPGAASPAASNFAQNPGDANQGLNQTTAAPQAPAAGGR